MAAKQQQGQELLVDDLEEVQKLLRKLPAKEGAPIMVPFGPVAFFPGKLQHTNTVYVEPQLAERCGTDSRSSNAATSQRIGAGSHALLQATTAGAADMLQQLLPHPSASEQAPSQQGTARKAVERAASGPPAAQHQVQHQAQQQTQQDSQLAEGQTPEQLEALRAALLQLGAKLEQQQAAASGGQPPSTEGKEIVDIREEWNDELHGASGIGTGISVAPAAGSGGSKGPAERGAGVAAGEEALDGKRLCTGEEAAEEEPEESEEGEEEDGGSVDSFEALMQRMEALEVDEAALAQAAAATAALADTPAAIAAARALAAGTPTPAAAAQKHGAEGARGSGFKPGFLLGKQLDPQRPAAAGTAAAAGSRAGSSTAAGSAARQRQQQEAEEQQRLQRVREEEAARRREAAFTGRIVERPAATPAPDPASPTAAPTRAAEAGQVFHGLHVQPEAGVAGAQQWEQQQQAAQPQQRVSRFKQRRAGV